MTEPGREPDRSNHSDEILTLSEAATLLRVEEAPLAELAAQGAIPAQKIGIEWRFLRDALLDWLRFGSNFFELLRILRDPVHLGIATEKLFVLLEQRLQSRAGTEQRPSRKPGSKHAIQRHVGVFANEDDLDEVLANLSAIRTAEAAEE